MLLARRFAQKALREAEEGVLATRRSQRKRRRQVQGFEEQSGEEEGLRRKKQDGLGRLAVLGNC